MVENKILMAEEAIRADYVVLKSFIHLSHLTRNRRQIIIFINEIKILS